MKLTPMASSRTRAWPGPGFGVSTSTYSSTSGPPICETRIAFMVLDCIVTPDHGPRASVPMAPAFRPEFERTFGLSMPQLMECLPKLLNLHREPHGISLGVGGCHHDDSSRP